jgi:predicted nucleic acid-binding protein
MRYLLDTNTITALARADVTARRHVARLAANSLWTCFVVVGEWECGLAAAARPARRAHLAAAGTPVFGALSGVWESSPAIATVYGALGARLRATG